MAIRREGTRRTSTDDLRMLLRVVADVGEQRVHRRLVGADDHAAAPDLLELPHGGFGLGRHPEQPPRVLEQQRPRLRERAVARRPVEEPFAEPFFDPAHRLADGRLGPVEAAGRHREAPGVGHRDEGLEVLQLHAVIIRTIYPKAKIINWTPPPSLRYNG